MTKDHGVPRRTGARTVMFFAAALAAGCSGLESSRGPRRHVRSVRENARPDGDVIARMRISQSPRMDGSIPVIALPVSQSPIAPAGASGTAPLSPLLFEDVMRSVESRFPLILAVQEQIEITEGKLESARGGFDLRAKAEADYAVEGFYDTEYQKLTLEQPTTWMGATLFGGYKLGNGNFPTWDGGFESNRDGELRAGVVVPLLAGRAIDRRRLALWQARVAREQADPEIAAKRLDVTRKAAGAYWKWVAAGQKLRVFRRLLELAENRQVSIEQTVEAGALAPIVVSDNRRQVVERRTIVLAAERQVQESAIRLSLFLRDGDGTPRLPRLSELPAEMPTPPNPEDLIAADDEARALRLRPELRGFELALETEALELAKAENDRLPRLDLGVLASDDSGEAAKVPDDKGPFELDVFLNFDLPVQRRRATGKMRSTRAKMRQIEAKLRFAEDRVRAQVQDTASELRQTWTAVALFQERIQLATTLEEAERDAFGSGASNLINVNIREQQTADAAAKAIDVLARHFQALAEYRAAVGVPYLEARR